jgi:hypothetical protein
MAALGYGFTLQNKQLDYSYDMSMSYVNWDMNFRKAWEACIAVHGEDTCYTIYGGQPYYMSYYGYGSGYGYGVQAAYPGCPYMDVTYCNTWAQSQQGKQVQAAMNQYATTAPGVYSASPNDPGYDEKLAKLEELHNDIIELYDTIMPLLESEIDTLEAKEASAD